MPDLEASRDDEACEALITGLDTSPVVAIGECGLDFTPEIEAGAPRARQIAVLRAHLAQARRRGLPLLLHCLKAHAVLIDLISEAPLPPSILHSWSGSPELALRFCKAGHYISFAARSPCLARVARPSRHGLSLRSGY